MPLWTNWQSRLSQKEKFSEFKSQQGYQIVVDMQYCLRYNNVSASVVESAYTSDLKSDASACGFKSHHSHQCRCGLMDKATLF